MIYTSAGIPLKEALPLARLAYAEWLRRHSRRPLNYVVRNGERQHKVGRDKNGDVYPVFRQFFEHKYGAGYSARLEEKDRAEIERIAARPMAQQMTPSLWHAVTAALKEYGSQRKAASALGISLGKLQRTLKMVPGGAVA